MAKVEIPINIKDIEEFKELIKSLSDNFDYLPFDVKQALLKFVEKEG
jgi:hypothetical protein